MEDLSLVVTIKLIKLVVMEYQEVLKKIKRYAKNWLGQARTIWSAIRVRRTRGCTRAKLDSDLICTPSPEHVERASILIALTHLHMSNHI